MKYNIDFFLSVLSREINQPILEFPFGKAIKTDALTAFRYAALSNSGYLDTSCIEKRLIIRRDYFRIINQVKNGEIQSGIFNGEEPVFKMTPRILFEKYPWMIKGEKYIFFLEYDPKLKKGEPPFFEALINLSKQATSSGINPRDIVVTLVAKNKPKDLEAFFEFYVCDNYRKQGYFTDSQLPFFYGVGTPDAGAIRTSVLINELFKPLSVSGLSVVDLMLLKYQPKGKINFDFDNKKVFEVKTTSLDGSQIKKYIDQNIFDNAFEVIPHKRSKDSYSGLIMFSETGEEVILEDDAQRNVENSELYLNWLYTYIKCFLITNLSNSDFETFKKDYLVKTTNQLWDVLGRVSFKEILNRLEL